MLGGRFTLLGFYDQRKTARSMQRRWQDGHMSVPPCFYFHCLPEGYIIGNVYTVSPVATDYWTNSGACVGPVYSLPRGGSQLSKSDGKKILEGQFLSVSESPIGVSISLTRAHCLDLPRPPVSCVVAMLVGSLLRCLIRMDSTNAKQ